MTSPDATATARLIFDASSIRSGVNQANQALGSLYDVVRNNWWGVKNIGDAFASVGGVISAGLSSAVSSAADFQSEMAAVGRTTYDATQSAEDNADATAKLGEQLKALSETNPTDLSSLTNIAEQAGALGVASDDVAEFTKTIAQFSAVTDISADNATQSLAKIANVFNLSADQYKNLGSSIYDAGVNTAATESQIVNMTTRLAPFAAAAGLSASQTVGLSAAVQSLGPRAEAGASAMQHLLGQMADAATGNDVKQMQAFADVTGVTTEEFQRMVQVDPGQALSKFVTGLAGMSTNAVTAQSALAALGINETREIATLEALAAGVKDGSGSYINLTNAMGNSTTAFDDGTALADAAAKQYQTFNAQLKELSNTVKVIAIDFSTLMLPGLTKVVGVTRDVVDGFQALPGPVKDVALGAVGLTGAFTTAAAAALLIGPRILLAADAYGKLSSGVKTTIAAQIAKTTADGEAASSSMAAAFAAARNRDELAKEGAQAEANAAALRVKAEAAQLNLRLLEQQATLEAVHEQQLAAESGELEVNAALLGARSAALEADIALTRQQIVVTAGETAALETSSVAMGGATVAAYGLGAAVDFMLGPLGIILGILAAVGIGLGVFGSAHKKAAADTQEDVQAQQDMEQAIKNQAAGQQDAINAMVVSRLAAINAGQAIDKYGLSWQQLQKMVTGKWDMDVDNGFYNLRTAAEAGDEGALKLYNSLVDLRNEFAVSAESVKEGAEANKALGVSADGAADSENDLANSAKNAKDAVDKQNEAAVDLTSALLQQSAAQLQAKEAQEEYNQARKDYQNQGATIAAAELKLNEAQLAQTRATIALSKAEKDLANARKNQQKQYQEDQRAAKEAELSYQDALQKVQDAEQAIKDAQGDKYENDLTEATNKLADAQLDLVDAQQKASDAQWYLNYLMEEGASNRDIQDAQQQLARANQDVLDSIDKVTDAQDDLNSAQQENSTAHLAVLERQLAEARLSAQDALDKLNTSEETLKTDRDNIANDTAYKNALLDVKEAQYAVADATTATNEAEKDVAGAKSGKEAADNLAQAKQRLEESLYNEATANVEVQKQTALTSGETWTAHDSAVALADQLTALGLKASGPVRDDIIALGSSLKSNIKNYKGNVTITGNVESINKALKDLNDQYDTTMRKLQDTDDKYSGKKWYNYLWDYTVGGLWNVVKAGGSWLEGVGNSLGDFISHPFGYANGGIVNQPTFFSNNGQLSVMGEAGAEAIIPLTDFYNTVTKPLLSIADNQMAIGEYLTGKSAENGVSGNAGANYYYNYIQVQANTNADPDEIANEIAWSLSNGNL